MGFLNPLVGDWDKKRTIDGARETVKKMAKLYRQLCATAKLVQH
jgi:hypothetical protein